MMTKIKAILTSTLLLTLSTNALADKEAGSGPNPYTDCGIGAALFKETHWAAVTSNVIWDLGITAIVSATASPETCEGKKVEAALFIRDTYDNIIEDTAAGEGEHVVALLDILQCAPESHGDIVASVRANMAPLVAADNYSSMTNLEKSADYYRVVNAEVESHAEDCSA